MRNSVEKWLQGIWYADDTPPWYLRMLVPLYRAGYQFDHRQSKNETPKHADTVSTTSEDSVDTSQSPKPRMSPALRTPLLVVGNITVGGSGKTPLVIALCHLARESGIQVGVASTGYGRKSAETLLVTAESKTLECGDEPILMARRTGAPVIVANRRREAVAELEKLNLDLIISDDGLQTAGLHRDIEICVVDGERGLGNHCLLPAGPLRENTDRLPQVDRIVSNGEWLSKPADLEVNRMDLVGDTFCTINGDRQLGVVAFFEASSAGVDSRDIHLFAAIGNPDRFFKAVRLLHKNFSLDSVKAVKWHEHRFADHHAYQATDFEALSEGATIVMTEKDAVKCRKLNLQNAWYLPVNAVLDEAFVDWFRQQLKFLENSRS